MLKKFSIVLLMLIVLAHTSFSFGATLIQEIKVYYNNIQVMFQNETMPLTEEPFIYNGGVYLPLRAVAEGLGYRVGWDSINRTVTISEKSTLEKLPAADPFIGEAFIYGEIRKIDYDKKLIEIEQHMENNSREVFEALRPIDEAVFLLQRNDHSWYINFEDLKIGDVVGIILTKENKIRGIIVD